MALTFDGTSHEIRCAVSSAANITFGTFAIILRKNGGDAANTNFFRQVSVTPTNLSGLFLVGNSLNVQFSTLVAVSPVMNVVVADNWQLLVCGKATGITTPRFYRYTYDTDTALFGNAAGTVANGTAPGTTGTYRLGSRDGGPYWNGDILIAGVWDRQLLDTEMENLRFSLQGWLATAPVGLWLLDQSAITQTVIDMTGNGGNETTRTGTAVATNHPKVWNRDGEVWRIIRTNPLGSVPSYGGAIPGQLVAGEFAPAAVLAPAGAVAAGHPFYWTTYRRRAQT